MKTLKILIVTLALGLSFSACNVIVEDLNDPYYFSLEDALSSYDLWYVDYNKTTGTGDVPFISKAFTLSFLNGKLYANNNLVGIGSQGNGYGIQIGYYNTFNGFLEIDHDLDGYYDLEVIQIDIDLIKLRDNFNQVTYYLEGYQKYDFDYDKIFYDNLEYFLQEYDVWEKTYTSNTGAVTDFDYENFLKFVPENINTFYSSLDEFGTEFENINFNYVGEYYIADVLGYDDLKILTLVYDNGIEEDFEISVINDEIIRLYHINSETTYEFTGRGYIQYLKQGSTKGKNVRTTGRKRTKVNRKTVNKNI